MSLVAALLLFIGLGVWQSRTFMVWSEEMIVHSMPAARVVEQEPDAAGNPRLEPSCLGPDAPWIVRSASRPTLNLCVGGRAWSMMIAPYFSGYLYWPFALLAPLHHDDAFVLRLVGMLLGVISIAVTWAVVRRLAGDLAASLTALATAVMPCFLLVHATLEHFETLPWIWMMAAVLSFSGCPGLAPRSADTVPREGDLPTKRLVLGALFLGLGIASNLKSVVIIAGLGALALRLGVSVRGIRKAQWARLGVALVVPLLPMIALSFAPDNGYSDKSSGWTRTLAAHLFDPRWLLSSVRGLVLLWADVADYFGDFIEDPRLNVVAVAVAVAALGFVIVDTARTVIRGRGCPVTAACGVCLLAFTGMVTLLYDHFPSNFTPLHTVYAASTALGATRLARFLTEKTRRAWVVVPVALAALLPFAWSSVAMIRSMADIRLHTNADAERALSGYLGEHAGEHVPVFTADVMLAGVLDSLSRGSLTTLRAHEFFSVCQPQQRNPRAPACVEDRWRKLLPFAVTTSARFVTPTDWSAWGSGHISYVPGLEQAAQALGYQVTLERTFATRRGVAVLSLYRIDAPSAPRDRLPP
ncbi:MAG: hypothetical protein ABJE95_09205 [Byssovorax sp.]